MLQIMSPNEACSEVLSLKAGGWAKFKGLPPDLFELIKGLKFPSFRSFELMRIKKELSNQDADMTEILKAHKFTFCFLPNQIERFIQIDDSSTEYTSFLACYVFYSYLSFEIIMKTRTDQHILVDFFQFFNTIAQEERFMFNPIYRKIAVSFEYLGFFKYLQSPIDDTINLFLPQLNDFFFYNNDLPPVAFEILIRTSNAIFNLPTNDKENEITKSNFLTVADGLVQQIKQYFPPTVARQILQRSFSSIRKLDISALSFLYHSNEIVDKETVVSCVYIFPPAIMSLFEEGIVINKLPTVEEGKHIKLKSVDIPEISFKPIENSNLTEMDLNLKTVFPEAIPIEKMIPKGSLSQIGFLLRLLLSDEYIAESFIKASTPFIIGSLDSPTFVDVYAMFLYFFIKIRETFPVSFVEETLFNEVIFDYNIVVYDDIEGYEIINTIRDECFKLILKDENTSCCYTIRRVLLDIFKYPLLYAETVARLVKYGGEYLQNIIFVSNIVPGIMKPMTYYQSFQNEAPDSKVLKEVRMARKSILTFLFTYLVDPPVLSSFMSNDYFAKSFFCLVFEEPLRETVITFITVFMSDANNRDNVVIDQLIQIMFLVFENDFLRQGNPKLLVIPARILSCINSCLRSIPELTLKFEQIIDPILESIICIQGSEHEEYLIQFILFLVFLTPIHQLKPHEAAALLKSSSQLGKKDPSANLSLAILQLISGKETTQDPRKIIVKQQHALILYLNIYINSKYLLECTQTLYDICKNSQENCIKAHQGELDLFCIELLSKQKQNQEVNMDIVHSLLSIIDLISSTISSVSVVQSFVSLFCPVEGRFLSPFHMDCIEFIDTKIKRAYYTPQADWPLIPSSAIEVRGLTTQLLGTSFTFAFWFFPAHNKYIVPIFTLQDTGNLVITIKYKKNILSFDVSSNEIQFNKVIIENIVEGKWCFISIDIKLLETSTQVSAYINNSIVSNVRELPALHMKRGLLYTIINFQKSGKGPKQKIENASKLSSFALLQTNDDNLYLQGPRKFSPNLQTTIFAFKPETINGRFVLTKLHQSEGIDGVYLKMKLKQNQKFIDVLIESCKFTLLLPLFAQMDMCQKNGKKYDDFIFKVISMTKRALLLSPNVITQFQQQNAFAIIEHLLTVSDESNITYKLYLAFYDLMISLPSSEQLKEDLFNQIVCNPNVWIHTTPAEHKQILKHWKNVLANKVPSYVFNFREFRWWINVLHTFYWFIPNEMASNLKRFRKMPVKVHQIREVVVGIALQVATFQFKESDLEYLITATISLNDMQQILHLLSVIKRIISSNLLSFFNKDFLVLQFTRLHILFKVFHPILFKSTTEVLMLAHDNNYIESTKSDHILRILLNLPPNFTSKSLLNVSITMLEYLPELLPITSWIAFNVGKKAIAKLANALHPSKEFKERNVNYIVTLATLFKASDHKKDLIAKFIVNIWFDEMHLIFGEVKLIGEYLGYNSDPILLLLLIKACDYVLEVPTSSSATLIKLCVQFIFVHSNTEGNQLIELFDNSPFFDENSAEENQTQKKNRLTANDVRNILSKVPKRQNKINLRFDANNGIWSDIKLATKLVSVILSSPKEMQIDIASVLCALLIRGSKNPQDSSPSVPDVMQDPMMQGLISYQQHKRDIPTLSNMKPEEYTKNSFDALERFTHEIDITQQQKIFSDVLIEWTHKLAVAERIPVCDMIPQIDDFMDEIELQSQKFARYWQSLWRSMTTTRAPWNKSLHKNMRVVHFKRDNCYCNMFCPFKLRRNYNFDDHMQASFIRDSGCDADAKAKLERYRAINLDQMKKIAPAQILEVDDIRDKENENNKEQEEMIKSIEIQNCALVKARSIKEIVFRISYDRFSITNTDGNTTTVLFKDLKYVFRRTFCHHQTAIEFFTVLHRSFFVDFRGTSVDKVMSYFKTSYVPRDTLVQMSDFKTFFSESGKTALWLDRKISNFEYLMYLNIYSGRSFNSPSQYPFFPWILSDYTSETIDLNDPNVYRDLSLPIGATNPTKFRDLNHKSKELESMGHIPYLYSSGQICPLSVYLWLMRMEPFTSLHIEIQGGKFDHAARIFLSIADSFRVTTHADNFRELPPEFFFSPEFLMNLNKFDLGKVESHKIGDVVLPPWAKDAFDFIYTQRKALESDYVSENIHKWIDFTWGNKQCSEYNLYKPEMYADIWDKASSHDPDTRASIEAVLSQVGQVPPQLFTDAHPARRKRLELIAPVSRPACIDIQINGTIFTTSSQISNGKCNAILINRFGNCQTCKIDLIKLMGPLPSPLADKRRQRSRAFTVLPEKSIVQSRSLSGPINDYEEISVSNSFYDIPMLPPPGVDLSSSIINGLQDKVGNGALQPYVVAGNEIIFVGDEGNDLYKISTDTGIIKEMLHHTCDIVGIAIDGPWFAVAGRDARICLFKGTQYHASISTYCDSIRCLAVSEAFDTLVCGTRDGSLLFCSLSRGEVVRVINLNGKAPKSVLITESMGFVVVYADTLVEGHLQHYLILFNINGIEIRNTSIECGVNIWETFKSSDSFDYIVMANEKGNIYVFEAFYLTIGSAINRCRKKITHLKPIKESNAIIAISEDATIHVFQYLFK